MIETFYIYEFRKEIFDNVCEVACVKFGGFSAILQMKQKNFGCIINQYLTLISHHAKGDPQKALMKAADP